MSPKGICRKECLHVPGRISETPLRSLGFTSIHIGGGVVCVCTGRKSGRSRSICRCTVLRRCTVVRRKECPGSRSATPSAYRQAEEAKFQVTQDRVKQDLQEVA